MMKMQTRFSFVVILLLMALLMAACGGEEEVIPTPTVAPPTEVPPTAVPPTNTPEPVAEEEESDMVESTAVPVNTVELLQSASVQIFAKFEERGQLRTQWTGSGTVISADGLILTNAHVAAPLAPGLAALYNDPQFIFGDAPDALIVGIIDTADFPPIESYQAEVVAADGVLDLAVIRIVADVDGTPIDAATLDLPFVPLGDSDSLNLGDEIQVFGFPGVGGDTLTFTRGDVSGFEIEDRVGTRAWIKTDTTFSPGNSGGLGANVAGEIVGVPSFVFEAQGGSINRLRSINYAIPLIEAAQTGEEYVSPYVVMGSGNQQLEFITWAEDFDEASNCAIGPVKSYAADAPAAVAIFSYSDMSDGEQFIIAWFQGDELLVSQIITWEFGKSGDCVAFYIHNFGDPLGEGVYAVELYAGSDVEFVADAVVAVGGPPVATDNSSSEGGKAAEGVTVTGTIVDADSGKPIPDAVIIVLQPGTDLDAWIEDPTDAEVFAMAETNGKGVFELPATLERNVEYPGVAWKEGYFRNEGFLLFDDEDPALVDLVLELSQ